ncbi:hypothetical protein CWC43_19365 [Klebsiella aerogenes]|nr:hypothetical protein CWC42_25520 [Klebsiella aerogenes]RXX26727.1 hypothetical protein CWC43_19365 [Klebsiella aerogenes]
MHIFCLYVLCNYYWAIGKIFFVTVLWILGDEFQLSWNDILQGIKIGSVGGGVLGIGIILSRLFKVEGF